MALQAAASETTPSWAPRIVAPKLGHRYVLGEVLGEGGICVVHAAYDRRLARNVAIKLLRPERVCAELEQRFITEARALARLKSPFLVEVLDLGIVVSDGKRIPYMVLERLEGCDLRQYLCDRAPLPVPWAVLAVLQAAEGLAAAHAVGIVHRDIKPENLFVLSDGSEASLCVKVLDFGIARLPFGSPFGGALTFAGEQMGSPGYTAPEQLCDARDVDERTDIWALGVVLYELLGDAPPYTGETQREICTSILTGQVRPLDELNSALPIELVRVVHRCLSTDRDSRYRTVAELARELAPFAGSRGSEIAVQIERRIEPTPEVGRVPPESGQRPIVEVGRARVLPFELQPTEAAPRAEPPLRPREPSPEVTTAPSARWRRSRVRRFVAHSACALALVPLVALAGLVVTSYFPATSAWSAHTVGALRDKIAKMIPP